MLLSLQVCVNEAIDNLLGGGAALTLSPHSQHSSPWLVAVVVPVTVVAGRSLGAIWGLLCNSTSIPFA